MRSVLNSGVLVWKERLKSLLRERVVAIPTVQLAWLIGACIMGAVWPYALRIALVGLIVNLPGESARELSSRTAEALK